jgi:hypothetical protein
MRDAADATTPLLRVGHTSGKQAPDEARADSSVSLGLRLAHRTAPSNANGSAMLAGGVPTT